MAAGGARGAGAAPRPQAPAVSLAGLGQRLLGCRRRAAGPPTRCYLPQQQGKAETGPWWEGSGSGCTFTAVARVKGGCELKEPALGVCLLGCLRDAGVLSLKTKQKPTARLVLVEEGTRLAPVLPSSRRCSRVCLGLPHAFLRCCAFPTQCLCCLCHASLQRLKTRVSLFLSWHSIIHFAIV